MSNSDTEGLTVQKTRVQPLTQPVMGLTHPPVTVKLTVEDVIRDLAYKKFEETNYQEANRGE